jgi:hypothetical protein
MDQYATFGRQAAFTPVQVDHVVRVSRQHYAGIVGECACGRRFSHIPLPALRRRVVDHAAVIVDDAPGAW